MRKFLYISCGWVFVGLAALGVVLPVLPTTPFLLVAAACFAKSSPTLYQWLLRNRVFGPLIKHWQETRTVPKKAKRIAFVTIFLAASWSIYIVPIWYVKLLVILLLIYPVVFLYRVKTTESLEEKPSEQLRPEGLVNND